MEHNGSHTKHYLNLGLMTAIMFVAMFGLMYAMVDRLENVFLNLNQFYMAALMTAPMVVIELILMRGMYQSNIANTAIILVSVAVLLVAWIGIRNQVGVGDRQFLRSMIPHHAGAILMCKESPAASSDIKDLCAKLLKVRTGKSSR